MWFIPKLFHFLLQVLAVLFYNTPILVPNKTLLFLVWSYIIYKINTMYFQKVF